MKFFEEQRVDLAGKISKKIVKGKDNSENETTELSIKPAVASEFYYDIKKETNDRAGEQVHQRIHHARRRPLRRGRGGLQERVPREEREPREARVPINDRAPRRAEEVPQPVIEEAAEEVVAVEEQSQEDVIAVQVEEEDNNRVQENEGRETQQEEPTDIREEAVEVEEESKNEDNESSAVQVEEHLPERKQVTAKIEVEEEKPQQNEVKADEKKEEQRGIQFSHFSQMVLSLFEFLQKQEGYTQLEDETLEIEESTQFIEANQIVKHAMEVSLLLEAWRRGVLEQVIEVLVFLKNYQAIISALQKHFGNSADEFNEAINKVVLENNLLHQDLLVFYAIYQIYKESVDISQRQKYIQQEKIYAQKFSFISELYASKAFSQNLHFSEFFEKLSEFQQSNNINSNKSYQIIATFLSVYSSNIEGIQVKNTEIFLQSVFTQKSWRISPSSTDKILKSIKRVSSYVPKLSTQEGSLVFNLQSSVQPEEGIVYVDCLNLLDTTFYSDSSIFTVGQIKNIEKHISKENSRISAKQHKSISDYVDEDYKIKFFFDDGLKLRSYLLPDEFVTVQVKNLPVNLRDQDLAEVLSILNFYEVVSSVVCKNEKRTNSVFYEITFQSKEQAKKFVTESNEQQIKYDEKLVLINPHFIPELQSINSYYKIGMSIGKTDEVKFLMTNVRNQEGYKKVKTQQIFEQIERFLSIKSNIGLTNLQHFKTQNLYELQSIVEQLQKEKVEEIFDIKLNYQNEYFSSFNIQKNIYDFFTDRFAQISRFSTQHIKITVREYSQNSKEMQVTVSSSNLSTLKKVISIISKIFRPICYYPLQSNKEKEVFFRQDFCKKERKNFTKSNFYTFFNTLNMRFEFYIETQFNFSFLNNMNSETFVPYEVTEAEKTRVETQMKTFQEAINKYLVKQSYYVHPSLQEEFLKYIKEQKGIVNHKQNDKLFELELDLETYLKINKSLMSQFVKASYLKKNEEIYNSKKAQQAKKNGGSLNNNGQTPEMQCCVVCYDSDHIFQLTNCACRSYCRDCLREQVQIDIQQNFVSFKGILHCPMCKTAPISLKDLSKLFNLYEIQSMVQQWVKCITYNSKNDNGQKQFAHCIYPKCLGIILIPADMKLKAQSEMQEEEKKDQSGEMEIETEKKQNNVSNIVCNSCNSALCSSSLLDSSIPYHSAHSSSISCMDHYLQQRGEMPSNAKFCPSCSQIYFHETGCNHLTCYQCGEHFCSICNLGFGKQQGIIYNHIQECEQKQRNEANPAQPNPEAPQPVGGAPQPVGGAAQPAEPEADWGGPGVVDGWQ